MPLLALPGNPDHREMGDTLPKELGEYSVPSEGSVPGSPGPPCGLEPASSSYCEFQWEYRRGRSSGRVAGTQISWSALSLALGPKEALTRDEKRRERGWTLAKLLDQLGVWRHFQSRTSEAFGSFWGDVADMAKDRLNGCMMVANEIKKGGLLEQRRRSEATLENFSGVFPCGGVGVGLVWLNF